MKESSESRERESEGKKQWEKIKIRKLREKGKKESSESIKSSKRK